MRTTITIPKELLAQAMEITGKSKYSEAIVTSIQDYLDLKKRLQLIDKLFDEKLPHSPKNIKTWRKKTKWSL